MTKEYEDKILERVKEQGYRPLKPRQLARNLGVHGDEHYATYREALRRLMDEGRVMMGQGGGVVLPTQSTAKNEIEGTYRGTKRGFGFVIPKDPSTHEELYIPEEGNSANALSGDVVRARIVSRGRKGEKMLAYGKIMAVIERKQTRFVGTLQKKKNVWYVEPDGNVLTSVIDTPDAAGRYLEPGTKVVVELTQFPNDFENAVGVIVEALGEAGEKDVDLRSVIITHNLPEKFPDAVVKEASDSVHRFQPEALLADREDLTGEIICTIDPDDAKDYDDAISLERDEDGNWVLGVHIADVSFFVPKGSKLDEEAHERGNSTYFPGHVIPMLPEVLSNGVCSLQEGVMRFAKSAFITLDREGQPLRTEFANSVIKSRKRLRYKEAQAIIDKAEVIPHPDGNKTIADYDPDVVKLLHAMNALAKKMQARRLRAGQLTLHLEAVDLVLNEQGKVIDAVPEDESFTHTLIEMFMVEANEAVARLLDRIGVPFLRRQHSEPDPDAAERLGNFVMVAGHKLPTAPTRHDLQALLAKVKGKPEEFAINMAVLRSLARAEYAPEKIGHFALASEHYTHFTSPIRRYCDLHIHRLLDMCFDAVGKPRATANEIAEAAKRNEDAFETAATEQDLKVLGQHISYTERRSEAAERELRQVKLLELMQNHIGEEFDGVVTGLTNFGLFIQIDRWHIEGLVRYNELLDDWWDVDTKKGVVRGQRTGQRIHIGDVAKVRVARVDLPRRELDVHVLSIRSRGTGGAPLDAKGKERPAAKGAPKFRKGTEKRAQKSRTRDKGKTEHRRKKK